MFSYARLLPLIILTTVGGVISTADAKSFSTGGLLENSRMDLTLKNVWMLMTSDQLADQGVGDQNAWAQSMHLDWQSGWAWDRVGLDASWYGVAKLYANEAFYGRDLLRDNRGRAEGFNKVGQLYGKARWGDEKRYLYLWAGWKQLYKFGALNVTRSRAAPSSWEGISSELAWDSFRARAAIVNRFSERDEPEKRRFMTLKSNKKIDYITTGELSWTPAKGSKITWFAGESKDYILRHGLEAAAAWPLTEEFNLLTRGAYYYNKGLSEWEGARGYSDHAQHIYALVGYQYGAAESGLGWSKTKAHLNNGLGHFYWHLGKNTRGAFNSPADGEGNDYINDGEQMLYLYSQYRVSPDLALGVYGNYGFGMEFEKVPLTEWEYGGYFSWDPAQIKGLNIFAGFGPSYGWKLTSQKTPSLTDDKRTFHRAKGIGAAVRVEYKFNLF
ncbi:OprD family outer membrane porin [Dryocola sp. BD586]|uniref:OprD family outer membrane porin n=1 Tax=Dryocola sp. BD586 TaxID=3133271 RepID=UPI003F4FB5F4